jgi:hypothetical protein
MNNHCSSKLVSKMKTNRLLLVALLAFGAPFAAAQSTAPGTPPSAATKPAANAPTKAYPLKVCLVTDNDLDSMGGNVSFVYQGREIKFCCKPCEKKFLRAPEKYLPKLTTPESAKK